MSNNLYFEHYIITRFNLPIFKELRDGIQVSPMDEEYLTKRLLLFKKYCFPSIQQQTCQNFKWLVLFDENTPQGIKEEMELLRKQHSNIYPLYLNLNVELHKTFPDEYIDAYNDYAKILNQSYFDNIDYSELIQRIITPIFVKESINKISIKEPDFYITTRIDNDDAFHKEMVATIQNTILQEHGNMALDFTVGHRYLLSYGVVSNSKIRNGHFITLIESKNRILRTALYYNHVHLEKFVRVKHLETKPMYVELIHSTNVANNFYFSLKNIIQDSINFKRKDFGYPRNSFLFAKVLIFFVIKIVRKILKK